MMGPGNGDVGAAGQRQDGAAAVLDRWGGPGRAGSVGVGRRNERDPQRWWAGGAWRAAVDGPGVGAGAGAYGGAGSGRVDDHRAAAEGPGAAGRPAVAGDRRPARAELIPGAGLYDEGYTGRARMVVDKDHGRLLYVTFVGPAWRS